MAETQETKDRRFRIALLRAALAGPLAVEGDCEGRDGRKEARRECVSDARPAAEPRPIPAAASDLPPGPALAVILPAGRRIVPRALVQGLVADGLLGCRAGMLIATREAPAHLKRLLADSALDGFRGQHGDHVVVTPDAPHRSSQHAPGDPPSGSRRRVVVNLAESPLGSLSRLKDRSGALFLPPAAVEAGERLAADFERGGLQPRITQNWEPRLSGDTPGRQGGARAISDSAAAARLRIARAVEAMGPELSGVALDVCCFCKGLETVERERQWPARSAKLMLRTALLALARHYAPPPVAGRTRHWGAEDFRPAGL